MQKFIVENNIKIFYVFLILLILYLIFNKESQNKEHLGGCPLKCPPLTYCNYSKGSCRLCTIS